MDLFDILLGWLLSLTLSKGGGGGIPPWPLPTGGVPPWPLPTGGAPPWPLPTGGVGPLPLPTGGVPPWPLPTGGVPPFPTGGLPPWPFPTGGTGPAGGQRWLYTVASGDNPNGVAMRFNAGQSKRAGKWIWKDLSVATPPMDTSGQGAVPWQTGQSFQLPANWGPDTGPRTSAMGILVAVPGADNAARRGPGKKPPRRVHGPMGPPIEGTTDGDDMAGDGLDGDMDGPGTY